MEHRRSLSDMQLRIGGIARCGSRNNGESAARNHGYRLTTPESEFVTFMDSDDVWLPHALATLHARLSPTLWRSVRTVSPRRLTRQGSSARRGRTLTSEGTGSGSKDDG